ncbi:MAG: hypothetical protein ACRD3T_01100 [Terriglobia bacterium]
MAASAILSVSAILILAAQNPSAPGYNHQEITDRNAYLYYTDIKTIVDHPPAELKHKYSELKHLQSALSQAALPEILQKTGTNIGLLFQNFPNTSCRETIREVRLTNDRTVDKSLVQVFNYIILPESAKGSDEFREYRTDSKSRAIDPSYLNGAALTTIGFASMPLIFLPRYQAESRFRYLGQDQIKHEEVDVVGYAQIFKRAQEMGYVDIAGRTALILTQGVAWIDPQTFQILRLRTDLLAPRPDILLDRQTTDIEFETVKFKNSPTRLWLPRQVTVEVAWNNMTFQNTHTYSHFRLFNVQTDQTVSAAPTARKP